MYLLFAGDNYYPCGGWDDYKGSFATEEAALEFLATKRYDWWHLVCGGQIVRSGSGR